MREAAETKVDFKEAISERYLAYALSTIMSRSLPDVRDGLKPVHRRILYAMMMLKLDPDAGFKKCARVVGDVIGKYHPHGDISVYDAMVRMAQTFASRYPTVEGQGNFGSIDGDKQAAMRYTESRLTKYAMLLLRDIEKNTVEFRDNYDGSDTEPCLLPSAVANILLNGTEGIAVGMATSIPPHNIIEVSDACIHLIKHPNSGIEILTNFIKAPDFPTGGVIAESEEAIRKAYATGKGSFRLRAKWHKEELERGLYRIIITEIPYQVQKQGLIEKMADLFNAKKLPYLESFQDMSAADIRIILIPKSRNINAEIIMESLFKITDLEVRSQLNMNVINASSSPELMNLKQVLTAFLEHRKEITVRRLRYRLSQIDKRLEILGGLLIAYLNLDEVIKIIREEDNPKLVMISKWNLSDIQAESILNMKLRSLRKLEEISIRQENESLSQEKGEIEAILSDEQRVWNTISAEIKEIKKEFIKDPIGQRHTEITQLGDIKPIDVSSFVEKEAITVVCSKMGWLRAVKGHQADSIKYKDGDKEKYLIKAYTTDKLMVFSNYGKFYTIPCDKIARGKGAGEPIRLMLGLDKDEDIISILKYDSADRYLIASHNGKGFIVDAKDTLAQTKSGKHIMTCKQGEALVCIKIEGDSVAVLGENKKLVIYSIGEIPELKRGQGVKLQNYKQGGLRDIRTFNFAEGLSWQAGSRSRSLQNMEVWKTKRGAAGRIALTKLWI